MITEFKRHITPEVYTPYTAYFVCMSAFRPHIVEPTMKITGFSPTWVTAEGQYNAYKNAGAEHVVETGPIVETRNRSLEMAFGLEHTGEPLPLLTMDDELSRIQEPVWDDSRGKFAGSKITFNEAVCRMFEGLDQVPNARLAGVAPTDNPFYFQKKRVNTRAFIVAHCMLIKPTELRFDKQAELKEDYDFTIQNMVRYGCVARRDDVLMSFAHDTKTGGVSQWRTLEIQNKVISYLALKWRGQYMRLNPKRAGEIILKF